MVTKEKLLNDLVGRLGLGIDPATIPREQSIQDMGMDSLALVKLIYTLEDEYGVTLKNEEILEVTTFGNLVDLLQRKVGFEQSGE